ncbi:calpain-B-like [Pomacea canaliculata]|uniref:calpain-B-like n=1 Tax=Pomacea canaliculata TaxID=400727 RepID=UPI000D72F2CB|nr:calpain-B-like [Pomacea canaliculata]XP_025084616.1 calpain-B-like [Pomacea canaliculata]XP_025084626.1 calpain-B-like [Pomacea canaliculata]
MTDYESIKRKCRLTGTLFEDKDFPASSASLYFRSSLSAPLIEWKRPKEIVSNPQFIADEALYVDLEQGTLGNCWFVAAAASLAASNKSLLHKVVPPDQNFGSEYAGIFRFNFWQYGKWREVIVDDRLPTREGRLEYAASTTKHEFWCALLEKAFAKLYGCYEAIDGGRVHDALLDMTGGITELIKLKGAIDVEKLTNILTMCWSMETLMGAAIFETSVGRRETRLNTGLYTGHAYSLIKHKTVTHKGQKKMLLLVRNPFGRGEWNGAWSDTDSAWSEISASEREDHAIRKRDDGEFWISVEDFIDNFDELELCHLSPDLLAPDKDSERMERKKWKQISFTGQWIKDVTSGGPLKSFTSRQFWTNPQFRVTQDHTGPVNAVISLLEVTDMFLRSVDDVNIGFVIFKLKPGKEPPARLTADNYYEHTPQLVDTSGAFWPYRERAVHFVLDPGAHVVVPCTFMPGQEAHFYLRIFSELPVDVSPAEERLGPTRELEIPETSLIDRLFQKHRGPDGQVDASSLQKILAEAKLETYGKPDGYSLETCRCLVFLDDTFVVGLLDQEKVKLAWKNIQLWTFAFKEADLSGDGKVDASELKGIFQKIGFNLDTTSLHRVVRRYGDREGRMHEDDFLQAFCRILGLYQIFKRKSENGKITMELSEWMATTLYS